MAGLHQLDDPDAAAYRLDIGDALLEDGFAPRDLLKTAGIDPTCLDGLGKSFNVSEPRIPAGYGVESGEWTNGDVSGTSPTATRQPQDEYRTGNPDKFFDTLYDPVHALARRLDIDETWLLGLAAHESGYLDKHNRDLNDPFGVTHGGGVNVAYNSIADAIAYWERRYGPAVQGATSAQDFADKLFAAGYNSTDPMWRKNVLRAIDPIPGRLSGWRSRRAGYDKLCTDRNSCSLLIYRGICTR